MKLSKAHIFVLCIGILLGSVSTFFFLAINSRNHQLRYFKRMEYQNSTIEKRFFTSKIPLSVNQSVFTDKYFTTLPYKREVERMNQQSMNVTVGDKIAGTMTDAKGITFKVSKSLDIQYKSALPSLGSKYNLLVAVCSRRSAFDRREIIRKTWAAGHNNIFFLSAINLANSLLP